MPNLITLTTDFGMSDWFVGTMKGVIAGIAPKSRVIDLTHEVLPGDIRSGAFALAAAYAYFPKNTVHVAVVDPGVGSTRRAVAVRTQNYVFVAPDNGVLSWALRKEAVVSIHRLENTDYFLQRVSRTFHGRDIFAPAAAHLSHGVPLHKLGPAVNDLVRLPWPGARPVQHGLEGLILYVDRFGNAITNIPASLIDELGDTDLAVFHGRKQLCRIKTFYDAVPKGTAVAVLGSSGFLEIAVNGGNAARTLKLEVDQSVQLRSR